LVVTVATVVLIGIDELDLVPGYLDLGAIVVISPDRSTLKRWQREQEPAAVTIPARGQADEGVVVDLPGHQVLVRGEPLAHSELEFRVLSALLIRRGFALSFPELRRKGWGETPAMAIDAASVRSLVQRLRVKLRSSEANVSIEAVRGFGFRIGSSDGLTPRSEDDVSMLG
jgi:DNA-binding response OmpR family regulator